MVGHLEDAADVRGLASIEKQVRLQRIAVAVALAREEAERDERVEEVTRAALVQAQPAAECVEGLRAVRELGEHAHFDGAQQRLGRPERQAGLEDLLGGWVAHVGYLAGYRIANRCSAPRM
jgi:predicted metal-dependent hydrolase